MNNRLDDFIDGQPLDEEAASEDPFLAFIPAHIVAQGVHKPFYQGYKAAFHVVRTMLGISEAVPTAGTLRIELAEGAREGRYNYGAVEHFIERGGSIRFALDYVIHQALWKSPTPLGDGSFDRKWDAPLPFPDPRPSSRTKAERILASPLVKSPRLGSPLLAAAQSESSPNLSRPVPIPQQANKSPAPTGRRRSNSFKDILFGRKDRASWLVQIQEDDCLDHCRQWNLKDEWDESGEVVCPLDTQFRGVRYLMGLHTAPRWETDDGDLRGVLAVQKSEYELKRTTARF